MVEISIRPSAREDLDGVLELWKELIHDQLAMDLPIPTHDENVRRQREFISKLVDEDPRQVQVAEAEGGELVGYVMCQKVTKSTPLELAYRFSYITDLYVKPKHRRKGTGRRLMRACIEYLESTGSRHVRLSVWHMNRPAIQLYLARGFKSHLEILQLDL